MLYKSIIYCNIRIHADNKYEFERQFFKTSTTHIYVIFVKYL